MGQPASGPQFANYREAVVANITEAVGSLDGVTLVEGPVEDTIPKTDVGPIAMLRLDTDHYDSTKVELDHYWPKLVPHGVVIVDDYGCYEGSRRATDEYFATLPIRPMLNRIDGGVFSGIKPGQGSCLFRRRLLDKILEVCLCRLGQLPPEGTPYMRRTASIAPVST